MSEEIRRFKIRILKNTVIMALVVIGFLVIADRAIKYYDIYKAKNSGIQENTLKSHLTPRQLHEYNAATTSKLHPYTMFAVKPNFRSETININSMGFRGPEILEKKENTVRIVVVGGSGAMGYGSTSDDTAFPHILENMLNNQVGKGRYEVINAGSASFIAMQEFNLIALKIIELEPDMVIIFDGFNDMVGSILNDRRPGFPWRFGELEKATKQSNTKSYIRKRLMNYRPTKKIIQLMEEKKLKRRKSREDYSVNPEAVLFYKKTLDRIAGLLRGYQIRAVFAYQPNLYYKEPRSDFESAILAKESPERLKVLKEMLTMGENAMREVAQSNNDIFISCTSVFNGMRETIFFDTVHSGDKGQEMLAQFLYDKLHDTL